YLGFYNGKIDGVFGWGTYWALRNFQYEFGMEVDGLAGTTTKNKLEKASEYDEANVKKQINSGKTITQYGGNKKKEDNEKDKKNKNKVKKQKNSGKSFTHYGGNNKQEGNEQDNTTDDQKDTTGGNTAVNVPQGYSQNDIDLMANAVHGEARGEPYEGQVAVAAVILNRVKSPTFPNTTAGVIFEPRAFTAVADGQIWLTPNETAKRAVLDAINGWDPSGNA